MVQTMARLFTTNEWNESLYKCEWEDDWTLLQIKESYQSSDTGVFWGLIYWLWD